MNAAERLHQHFSDFDPAQIERVFGREFLLNPPDPAVPLAPVKRSDPARPACLAGTDGDPGPRPGRRPSVGGGAFRIRSALHRSHSYAGALC